MRDGARLGRGPWHGRACLRPGPSARLGVRGGALWQDRRGQMTVELAVTLPVALALAFVVLNLMGYVEACAAFDQACLDAVLAHGVSASGGEGELWGVDAVQGALEEALGRRGRCEVSVSAEQVGLSGNGSVFAVSALLTRYECMLTYRPWPRLLRLPGVTYEAPLALRHARELVVDRFRPGVVM